MLTKEEQNTYQENGYLIVDSLYTSRECDNFLEEAMLYAEKINDDKYSAVLNIHRYVPCFLSIMKNKKIVQMVKQVQNHDVTGLHSQFIYKIAGTAYAKQSWNPHQDNSYVHANYGEFVVVHLFLDDSDKENGGLYFYESSHKEELLDYENVVSWREPFDDQGISHPGQTVKNIPDKYTKIDISAKKGSICFMHGHLIHGSYPNLSKNRSRPQYLIGYLNKNAQYKTGGNSHRTPIDLD